MSAVRVPRRSLALGVLRRPSGIIAVLVVGLVALSCALADVVAPYDPLTQDLSRLRELPSPDHLLGTDSLGRDLLSRLLHGGQDSLLGVTIAVAVALVISIPLGITAGYLGGPFDRVVLAAVDVLMSVPGIIITLAVLAIFNSSMTAAMITVGALASGAFIRLIRSTVLETREELFIRSARVIGLTNGQIIVRHVLPHALGVILVQSSLFAAATLGIQTGLAFLSFGPQPPAPTWGGMVAEAATLIQSDPWMLVPSGGIIAITTLGFGLLGDALRDANADRYLTRPAAPTAPARVPHVESRDIDPQAVLSVRNLSVEFGHGDHAVRVVHDVSFDVQPGEVVGLVGESGSGKTVVSLAILGLLGSGGRVVGGSITFAGRDLVGATPREYRAVRGSGIAMISQEPLVALDPSFRVGDQVAEVVRTHDRCSRRQARDRALELLAAVKLRDPQGVARSYPHQISGGMAQRVAIAAALAGRPRLLIADEPTTALDVTVQAEILDLLRSLQESTGMAVLLVTHDWGVVAEVCSAAKVMYAGQIVEEADVLEMFDRPRHPYTRGLLESSPHLGEKGAPLPTIGGRVPPPRDWPVGCHFAPRCRWATDECRRAAVPLLVTPDGRTSRCIRIDEFSERAG